MELKPGYKKTKVGIIPREWSAIQLGELSDFVTSGSRGWAKYYSDSGAIFIRSQNIRDGHLDLTDRQCVIPPSGAEGDRTRLVAGDLMVTITGNNVGNVAWLEKDIGEAYISQHVGLVRLLDPSYSEYVCRYLEPGSPGNAQIFAGQAGQSKPGLNLKNLEDFWIAIPPTKVEQEAIAEALSDADALIESLDQLIAKKRQIKQGAMQELLTGKRRLPGFSGEWVIKRLGDVAEISKGQLITESTAIPGDVPVIAGGKKPAYFHNRANRTGKTITISGSGASAGYVAFYESPIFASDCSTIGGGGNYSVEFIYFVLLLNQEVIYKAQTGGAQPHIHPDDLRPLMIHVPIDCSEQAAIATILSDMDTELAALESRLAKARQIKQGMMQELLTGRIRLL